MSAERWRERIRKAWQEVDEVHGRSEAEIKDAGENFWRALLNRPPVPPAVRDARIAFERHLEDWMEDGDPHDPVQQAVSQDLMRQATDAECAAGIHAFCACRRRRREPVNATPPDEEDPVTGGWFDARRAQVWGVIQPDGSVVAKGFVGDETADEDQAVYPAGSLAYYSPERGWTNAATGHPAARGPARRPGLGQPDWDNPDPPEKKETAVPRNDRYGDRGPKRDQSALDATYAVRIGETTRIHRLDGSEVDYKYTVAGWRMVAGTDTKANAKAEVERDLAALAAADVKVHHTDGCGLCGRTDQHTHSQSDWRAHIGGDGHGGGVYDAPPAAEPYTPPKRAGKDSVPSAAEVGDAECRADALAREGASAAEIDAADAEFAWLDEARAAAYEAEAQRQADHRRCHNEFIDAENEKSAAHRREQDEETASRLRLAANLARHDAAVEARKRPDLADLRRGRWYDEKPITSTNTGSGGSGMSSIDEVRAGIMSAVEKMNEGLGAVQHGHACVEEAQGQLMHATEGSGQADVSEANGLLAQAVNDLDTVRQQVAAAISASEGVANRL